MYITDDIIYAGVNDHQLDLFEGQYQVPNGMAYNSYVIKDEKIAVMDTVDGKFTHEWLDNVEKALAILKSHPCVQTISLRENEICVRFMGDKQDEAMLLQQLPILAAGLAAYGGGMALTYQTAAARFEKVDLS